MVEAIESVSGSLKTGDLVLFAPQGLASWLRLGRRRWKHVALVVRDAEHAEPMIWETSPAGAVSPGVRLRRLAKRLARYRGRIGARRLNRPLGSAQCDALAAWRAELQARRERGSLIGLMGAGDDGWLGADEPYLGALLPGELVAEGYQRIGLLTPPPKGGMAARWYTPNHFSERARLRLGLDYALGPEIPLTGTRETTARPTLTPQPA